MTGTAEIWLTLGDRRSEAVLVEIERLLSIQFEADGPGDDRFLSRQYDCGYHVWFGRLREAASRPLEARGSDHCLHYQGYYEKDFAREHFELLKALQVHLVLTFEQTEVQARFQPTSEFP